MRGFLEPLWFEQGVEQIREKSGRDEKAQPGHGKYPEFGVMGSVMEGMCGFALESTQMLGSRASRWR
jgi:hypothetical protein